MLGLEQAGPRLLAGVSCCSGGAHSRVTACVVESTGEESCHEEVRLPDLVRKLWPLEHNGRVRGLRLLNDFTKHDFFIRRSQHRDLLVRSDVARAIIEPNRAIFLGTKGPAFAAFKSELLENLRSHQGEEARDEEGGRSFELFVLECIVCATVTLHTLKLQVMKPVIEEILHKVELSVSEGNILRLYPLKVALSNFIERVRPISMCFRGLIHSDPDADRHRSAIAVPPLSRSRQTSGAADILPDGPPLPAALPVNMKPCRSPSSAGTGDETGPEDMLETWAHNTEEILAEALDLAAKVEDATRFLDASLSCMRNRLLRLELGAMCISLAFAFGAMLVGVFGMNLKSGIEDWHSPFYVVLFAVVAVGYLICWVGRWFYNKSKNHYRLHCDRYGDNAFFRGVADNAYILALAGSSPTADGSLCEAVREQVLRDLRTPNRPTNSPPARHRTVSLSATPGRDPPLLSPRASPSHARRRHHTT